jgi:Arylsulfotransferase (ASST)
MTRESRPEPRKRLAARRGAGLALFAGALALTGVTASSALAAPTAPPPVSILTSSPTAARGGDFFITPFGDASTYANGPEILSPSGKVVWFHAVPAGQEASDFRVQRYDGKPVLTWWQGTGFGGLAAGTDYIYNDKYQQIAAVNAGNGLSDDGHEFLITPWNTAFVLSYTTTTADLTSIGGPSDQTVINGVVQEIDISTGRVLWQWNSEDHVPFSQSEQPLPASAGTPWDWFHINAIKLNGSGQVLIDARDTWTAYDVSLRSGKINWQLGGKDSSFKVQAAPGQSLNNAGEIFAWQHDPQPLGNDTYSFFDNESAGVANTGADSTAEFGVSRVVTVKLNQWNHTATLIKSVNQPEGLVAPSQGNGQTTADGSLVAGWGSLPYFSEFNPSGGLTFNAEFPVGVNTYRAYQFQWPQSYEPSWPATRHHWPSGPHHRSTRRNATDRSR